MKQVPRNCGFPQRDRAGGLSRLASRQHFANRERSAMLDNRALAVITWRTRPFPTSKARRIKFSPYCSPSTRERKCDQVREGTRGLERGSLSRYSADSQGPGLAVTLRTSTSIPLDYASGHGATVIAQGSGMEGEEGVPREIGRDRGRRRRMSHHKLIMILEDRIDDGIG